MTGDPLTDIITSIIQNAPAVAALLYIVWRMDKRQQAMMELLADLCRDKGRD